MKPSIDDLAKVVKSAGGILERDTDLRDMRCLQCVAPDGKRWTDGACVNMVVYWPANSKRTVVEDVYRDAIERLACGLEDDPDFEE